MSRKELLLRIYNSIKPYRIRMLVAMLCMILLAGFSGAQAYMVKPMLDKIFFEQQAEMLTILPILLIIVFACKGVAYYGYRYLLDTTGERVVRDLRNQIFRHIHSLPLSFFYKTPTGELISRVISDVALIQRAVSRAVVTLLRDTVQIIAMLGLAFYLDWKMALIALVVMPMAVIPIVVFGKRFWHNSNSNQQTVALISGALHETIGGHRIVKSFGMEGYECRRFESLTNRLIRIITKEIQMNSLQHPLMEMIGGVAFAGIIWYGGYQVLAGESTPGTFFAFLTAVILIYDPIRAFGGLNSMVMQGFAAAARVYNLLDVKPSIVDRPGAVELKGFSKEILFKDTSFSYDGENEVLKGINLRIRSGEVLAIVGSSGGGKSTLVNLIPRFFDVTNGSISIDGVDLRDIKISSLRAQIALVEQQTVLFNDTVRNNIAYGDHHRSDEEIIAAAKAAYAYEFINRLPQGFDTLIGEGGARLSGGQRQRLSIARALLKNAPVLILDEATSSLDSESEREVQKALENLMADRTTLVIAHRLSTIKNADRIIVMDDGRIAEQGDHQTLSKIENGIYRMLCQQQS